MDGFALAHGIRDLRKLDLDRLCNFVYWRITDGAEAKEVEKFRARLWQPPRGVVADPRSPWSAEAEQDAFAAAIGALTGSAVRRE